MRNLRRAISLAVAAIMLVSCGSEKTSEKSFVEYVNPFIGTLHEGHCFPGATAPMGMMQASPESVTDDYKGYTMDHVTGYQYVDPYIIGFTNTHLNGVGCSSMSDILLVPFCDKAINGTEREEYRSTYDKASEIAEPGYYGVYLKDGKVKAEMTTTPHVAYHRYKFDNPKTAQLVVDLQYGVSWDYDGSNNNVLEANQEVKEYSIDGYRKPVVWAQRDQYYTVRFNKKIVASSIIEAPEGNSELAPRYQLTFDMGDSDELEVQVAISTTSCEAALNNLDSEIKSFGTFDAVRKSVSKEWNKLLSMIDVEGDHESKVVLYTAIYHMYSQPNNIADVDGSYRAASGEVCKSRSGKFYSTLSLWDTYRATHPLYTILTPSLVPDINASIMDHYTHMVVDSLNPFAANRFLPRWALWGKETNTMVANHAVPVLVDAWLKGQKPAGYSDEELFSAIWETLTKPHYRNHTELIDRYGYIPYDISLSKIDDQRECVSRLLEGCYDDYCGALLAEKLGKTKEAEFLLKRAANYKNTFDKESGFMSGRNSKGEFRDDLRPNLVNGEWVAGSDFTEGNAWHYLFHVQHDVVGYQELMGKERFSSKLDSMFYSCGDAPFVEGLVWKIYGLLGQYWHGNEPCHHVPYLYKYTDQGYKTDAIINYLVKNFSLNAPDGLKGNDDCGQMSAWYIFATMGLYPVNPCGGEFILGAPQLPEITLNLESGKKFKVVAKNLSSDNIFVESVTLNGVVVDGLSISYDDIMKGGELVFSMTSRGDRAELQNFKLSEVLYE